MHRNTTRSLDKLCPQTRRTPPPSSPWAGAVRSPEKTSQPGKMPNLIWVSFMTRFSAQTRHFGEFSPGTIKTALARFWEQYDPQDDATTWFEKIKTLADSMGFATNMKLYKQNPDAWPGSVTDVSTFCALLLPEKPIRRTYIRSCSFSVRIAPRPHSERHKPAVTAPAQARRPRL